MIQLINISKNYKTKSGEVQALKGINLTLPDKGMVFILGKSGCGKTTLLNIIGGLDSITDGEVIVDDVSIKSYKGSDYDEYRNKYIGFVFQEYKLIDNFNVEQNISLALELQKEPNKQEQVEKSLEEVGLQGYGKRHINELSGGQKQRVAIARAIIKNPSIVLADEPTGNLDSITAGEIFDILKKLSEERLVLVVSHDRESAESYGDRIIELRDGEVISDTILKDTTQEVKVEEKESRKQKRTGNITFGRAIRYAFSNLWHKKIRVTVSILLFVITLGLFHYAFATSLFDIYKTVEKTFSKTDKDVVYLNVDSNDLKTYSCVEEYFKEEAFPIYVDRRFSLNDFGYKSKDSVYYDTDLSLSMKINVDIAKKLNLSVFGRLPQKADEICISKYKAESILYCERLFCESLGIVKTEDFVGKQIDYDGFTIVGIIDTKFPKMFDEVKEMSSTDELNNDYEMMIKFGNEKDNKLHDVMFCHESYYDYYYIPQNQNFEYDWSSTYGINKNYLQLKDIKYYSIGEEEGILIHERDVRNLLLDNDYDLKDIEEDMLSILKNNVIILDFNYNGIYDDYRFSQRVVGYLCDRYSICLTDGFLEEFRQEVGCVAALAIDPDNEKALHRAVEVSNLNDSQSTFCFNSIAANEIEQGKRYAELEKQICGIASPILAVIVILFLLNYFMSTIKDKYEEIGILRAIGVKNSNIIGIFLLEAVIICVIAYLISLPITFAVANKIETDTMNSLADGYDVIVNYIEIGFVSCIVTFIMALGVAFIGCITPFIKLGRMKPMEIIRRK